jgi:activator of 2-hydroxyglutaryl-CoA dehydratase
MTGGGAKNTGLVQRFENKLGLKILLPPDSQVVGALGAALLARKMATGDL